MQRSILIAGVGGQGTLLASKIIGGVAIKSGYNVKVSEVHGMAQRGGSVVTYVKYSDSAVYSPLIDDGEADYLIAFEQLEAYRCVNYLKTGGIMLANTQKINPMPVILGAEQYPADIVSKLQQKNVNVIAIDALQKALDAGNERCVNMVLIGLYAAQTDISRETYTEVLGELLPPKLLDVNLQAFDMGYEHK